MKKINIENWKRKEYFEFFNNFDEPFFGIVSEVDCTSAYKFCKEHKVSFYAYYLYCSLVTANQIPEFKHRFIDGEIYYFDKIHASPTIGREDGTFGYGFIPYSASFSTFAKNLKEETLRVTSKPGLCLGKDSSRFDVIHFSAIPWIKFTGITHARNYKFTDSVPKIAFGRFSVNNQRYMLPVAVNCHHGFADGLHVANYLEKFTDVLENLHKDINI